MVVVMGVRLQNEVELQNQVNSSKTQKSECLEDLSVRPCLKCWFGSMIRFLSKFRGELTATNLTLNFSDFDTERCL